MAALLALLSSLLWGTGDFLGGRASRGWKVLQVLFWSQLATFLLIWVSVGIGSATGVLDPTWRTVLIGAAGGVGGVIALAAFYKALAIGPMSVVPPIAAAGVVLPVGVGLATGAAPSTPVVVGMVLAIVGVMLASIGEGHGVDERIATRVQARTLGLCAIAALGFGLIFVAMDVAAGDDVQTAVVATAGVRLGSFLTVILAVLATRTDPRTGGLQPRVAIGFAAIGVFDTAANLTFAIAAALGELEIVAVLGSLYPAVTSALAHVILKERLGRLQLVGVVLALAGVATLALR